MMVMMEAGGWPANVIRVNRQEMEFEKGAFQVAHLANRKDLQHLAPVTSIPTTTDLTFLKKTIKHLHSDASVAETHSLSRRFQ
jgi:hypothetical protein